MNYVYAILIGYFCGSIPTAWLIAKIFYKINIFEHGSKNMGSTNVYRVLGAKPFAATLAIDVLKGMTAVIISTKVFYETMHLPDAPTFVFISTIMALVGHTLSFWVKFKGGKGVATGLGVFIALSSHAAFSALGVFLVILFVGRMVSLSSICAAASLPFFVWYFKETGIYTPIFTIFTTIIALFVIYKHKSNISRIIKGTESKLTLKSEPKPKEDIQ